jgi:DNA polymerase III epsilon subunit-like protein
MNDIQKENVLISVDVETTGESPVTSSCVMIGCVVFKNVDVDSETLDTDWIIEKKRWCIDEVPGRPMSERCRKEFWSNNSELWNYIKQNCVSPTVAMESFTNWYGDLLSKYNCVFIARPSSFDWQWLNCIYDEFGPTKKPLLPYSVTCVSTMCKFLGMIDVDWNKTIKPLFDHPRLKMTHFSDDDAAYQAYMYLRIIHWMRRNICIDSVLK